MENRKTKFILLCCLIFGCILTSIAAEYFVKDDYDVQPVNAEKVITEKNEKDTGTIKVYVSGAVKNPGIYDIKINSRASDAVEAAGGFTENANPEKVNLAKKLKDGNQVNVPSLKVKKLRENNLQNQESAPTSAERTDNRLVNINTAGIEELDTLPGVGSATAQKIIDYRQIKPFQKIEDIMNVTGIGEAKFAKMKSRLTV